MYRIIQRHKLISLHFMVVILGFTGILGKLISLQTIDLVWFRMLLAFICLFIFLLFKKKIHTIKKRNILPLLSAGAIVGLHWLFFFEAIKVSNVAIAVICLATSSLFSAFLEPIFFKRKILKYEVFFGAIVMLVLSYMLYEKPEHQENEINIYLTSLSKYNLNRKHPILNTIRAHTGVDYAATTGTPVRATGEGTVIFRANKGGYGRLIELRHFNEYTTRYAHLSGYSKGLQVGSKVDQGDIIGYVGKSGLATGPHLHYEFRVNGMHTDPLRVKFPNAKPIESENKEDFTNFALALDLKMNTLKKKLFSSNEEKIEE